MNPKSKRPIFERTKKFKNEKDINRCLSFISEWHYVRR